MSVFLSVEGVQRQSESSAEGLSIYLFSVSLRRGPHAALPD